MSNRICRSQEERQSLIELEKKTGVTTSEFSQQHELNYKYYNKRDNRGQAVRRYRQFI